jgi:hypothetical protein
MHQPKHITMLDNIHVSYSEFGYEIEILYYVMRSKNEVLCAAAGRLDKPNNI